MILIGVAEHLAAPNAPRLDPVDPSLEGPFTDCTGCTDCMATSSVAWADAEVAAGGDRDRAVAAARRTLAFYTGSDGPQEPDCSRR